MIEPAHLDATRNAYDTVAADYAVLLRNELAAKPLDRALLATFAENVCGSGGGRVAEVGCGPGRITAHLHSLGLDASGLDLSPTMVAVARQIHPDLNFQVGSITALDLEAGQLDGLVAWYSIIHTPPAELAHVFSEFARVLRPGGHVLIAFQVGDNERVDREQAYGHEVALTNYRFSPDLLVETMTATGLRVHTRVLREPEGEFDRGPQAYLLHPSPYRHPDEQGSTSDSGCVV